VVVRSPHALRPWQHVLEPLAGYLRLAELLHEHGPEYGEGWNFGPSDEDAQPVSAIVERLTGLWGEGATWMVDGDPQPHEAHLLKLDSSKARSRLGWKPRWNLPQALSMIVEWHKAHRAGHDMRPFTLGQIRDYMGVSNTSHTMDVRVRAY
jgi:CDP-glucose 4,6-dehydratase